MIFVGIDWAEAHHGVCVLDEQGEILAKGRVANSVEGVARVQAMVADHAEDPTEVLVGIETDRGLLVGALVAAGYRVYAVNPLAVSRYRDRHATSGAKSDPGDAKVLADLVRIDRHNHREVAGDSGLAEAVKVLARAHQSLIWTKQRQVNALRSALREFYPAALRALPELGTVEACSILGMAPTPERGRRLTLAKVRRFLAASGRTRNLDAEILGAPANTPAGGLTGPLRGLRLGGGLLGRGDRRDQIVRLEAELAERFEEHPDAEILRSLPGLGLVLGARVLAEFGDDRTRYADARARKNYAGTSPITRASGKGLVVLARVARNKRLADACYLWAFASLNASPGAPPVLRRASYGRQDPSSVTSGLGQPPRRDPSWLPPASPDLPGRCRLANPARGCGLSVSGRGMSRACRT